MGIGVGLLEFIYLPYPYLVENTGRTLGVGPSSADGRFDGTHFPSNRGFLGDGRGIRVFVVGGQTGVRCARMPFGGRRKRTRESSGS